MGSFLERFENDKPSRKTKVGNLKGADQESCSQILLQTRLASVLLSRRKRKGGWGGGRQCGFYNKMLCSFDDTLSVQIFLATFLHFLPHIRNWPGAILIKLLMIFLG